MPETDQNIEIRNAPIQDIIGRSPGWITTWGTTIVFSFIFLIILFSFVFKFPDTVKSEIVLTTENSPATLIARSAGKIQRLFVTDNKLVKPGEILAIIENPADYRDVMVIKRWTDSMHADTADQNFPALQAFDNTSFQLGEIQPLLSDYLNRNSDYHCYGIDNPVKQRMAALKQELERYSDLNRELAKQSSILKKEFEIMQKQHDRNKTLHAAGSISDVDLEESESLLLSKDYEFGQTKVALSNNRLQETRVNQEIITLESEFNETLGEKERKLQESLLNLRAAIATWENRYVLITSVPGKVSFSSVWNENQSVTSGELVMTVVPLVPGRIIGKVKLSMEGAGKVKEGQQVIIKLAHYPYLEFGMLQGKIESIAAAPDESIYMVQVSLPDSLITTYGKTIIFRQEMQGKAEIITEELTLMTRILNPIRHIIRRHKAIGRL
jgi:multidrug resistance efflux pump